MTKQEAIDLKSFKNYCNCGGYAWSTRELIYGTNKLPKDHPHYMWCNQYQEWEEWKRALEPEAVWFSKSDDPDRWTERE